MSASIHLGGGYAGGAIKPIYGEVDFRNRSDLAVGLIGSDADVIACGQATVSDPTFGADGLNPGGGTYDLAVLWRWRWTAGQRVTVQIIAQGRSSGVPIQGLAYADRLTDGAVGMSMLSRASYYLRSDSVSQRIYGCDGDYGLLGALPAIVAGRWYRVTMELEGLTGATITYHELASATLDWTGGTLIHSDEIPNYSDSGGQVLAVGCQAHAQILGIRLVEGP